MTLASVGMDSMKRVPSLYKLVFSAEPPDLRGQLDRLVSLADKARREGLLALDALLPGHRGHLHAQRPAARRRRHRPRDGPRHPARPRSTAWPHATRPRRGPFEKAGGFAPTMGIIGTVLGPRARAAEPRRARPTLGPSISAAFIATLMGVGSANVIFLPIANRLKAMSAQEVELRTLTLEGILAVQAGENPRVVNDKLSAFVPPDERGGREGGEDGPGRPRAA